MLGDCPTIHVGGAHELFRRFIQHIRLRGLFNKFYRNSVVSFQEQKAFVLKIVILLAFGLGMYEGVGENSRHGIWACRHSSRIMYLLECDCLS